MNVDKLYLKLEEEMLENIAKQLKKDMKKDPTGQTPHWRTAQLDNFGVLNHEQLQTLAKYSGVAKEEIQTWIEEIGIAEATQYGEAFEKEMAIEHAKGVNTVKDRLEVFKSEALDQFDRIQTSMLQGSHKIYRDTVTKASADILLGQKSLYQSVRDSTKEWASSGIPVLVDSKGRTWGAEGYITMVVRQTQKKVATQMQEDVFDQYGMDIVEISQHMGSRPSHAPYQGKRYSRSGTSKEFPPLSETGYGAIDGLVTGIGCRHHMYGVHPDTHKPIKLPERNAEETQKNYIESQKQRALERGIRKAKREEQLLKEIGASPEDLQKAHEKVLRRQESMRNFIEETGLPRRRGREGAWSGTAHQPVATKKSVKPKAPLRNY